MTQEEWDSLQPGDCVVVADMKIISHRLSVGDFVLVVEKRGSHVVGLNLSNDQERVVLSNPNLHKRTSFFAYILSTLDQKDKTY